MCLLFVQKEKNNCFLTLIWVCKNSLEKTLLAGSWHGVSLNFECDLFRKLRGLFAEGNYWIRARLCKTWQGCNQNFCTVFDGAKFSLENSCFCLFTKITIQLLQTKSHRGCSAVVARSLCMWKAPGSNPGSSTFFFDYWTIPLSSQ